MNDKLRKDLIILGALIIVCAFLARFLARGETLEEYAQNNPSAVATHEASVSSSLDAAKDVSDNSQNNISTGASNSSQTNTSAGASDSPREAASDSTTKDTATDNLLSKSNDASSEKSTFSEASATNDGESDMNENLADRVTYSQGFYYEPIPEGIIDKITGVSYVENENISIDDLRYVVLLYNDFNGKTKTGEMICNKKIAQDIVEIFYELYTSGYQIESIRLIDEFGGDDTASMLANNTSCFNYRVVENTTRLSNHAYGLAIDINPFYNPYITYGKDGSVHVSPEGSEAYADRSQAFPYKIDENDLAYKLFKAHGFKWGGDWNSVKDYQHFERSN